MTISASINAEFLVGGTTYNATISIPDAIPTGQAPFLFGVTGTTGTTGATPQTLLQVAVGGSGNVYVAVSPPMDLLQTAAPGVISNLNVVVSEGTYSTTTKTFSN